MQLLYMQLNYDHDTPSSHKKPSCKVKNLWVLLCPNDPATNPRHIIWSRTSFVMKFWEFLYATNKMGEQDGPNAYSLQFTKISKRLKLFPYEIA